MADKTVKLTTPVTGKNGQKVYEISIREPRYADYINCNGVPVTYVQTGNGGGFEQETTQILDQWIEALCDIDPNVLAMCSLKDTFFIREAILDFFREASKAVSTSKLSTASQGSSSAPGDGSLKPSNE